MRQYLVHVILVKDRRGAKVSDFSNTIGIDKNVLWLQIEVHDFLLMEVDQRTQDLSGVLSYFFLWHFVVWFAKEHKLVGLFVVSHDLSFTGVLHQQVHFVVIGVIYDLMEAYDVGMHQHFMDVNLAHGVNVGFTIGFAHHATT